MAIASSSVVKGETLVDTAMNLEAMSPSMIVLRHASSGACHLLSRICKAAIVNAGDGMHEHPTQALLDAFTIRERKGRLAGLKVAIVGDLLHSRVLRSNVLLLTKLGADVWVCAPATLIPPGLKQMGVHVTTRVDEAVEGADVIMMLRIQLERMEGGYFPSLREYFTTFGMTEARVARAKPDVIIMHPGPINRGVEIASEVADGSHSVILEQVANGVAVRMAVLYLPGLATQIRHRLETQILERTVKRLLKGGRVVDPANGRDGIFDVLIDGDRIAAVGANLDADGAEVITIPAGLRDLSRASSTCTCTCASRGRSTRRPWRRAWPPPWPAALPPWPACRIPGR